MEFFYYSKQWPGTKSERIKRFFHILLLEIKRVTTGTKYLAEFDLSDNCNLHCRHCYHFRAKILFNEEVSINLWESKFNELYKKGIRRVLLIGGEPAIRMDVIKLAHKIFPYIDICSNGTIFIDKFYKQKIFVSIDGDKTTHDYIRGDGVFDRIVSNYKNDNRVVISMTITKENILMIENVIKLSDTLNLIGVSCDIYTPSPGNASNDSMTITDEERKIIISELRRLKKLYKQKLLMSKKAISWFEHPNHSKTPCYWRSQVIHFNSRLEEKPACDYYDCANCGHFAGANLSPLNFMITNET